MTVRLIARPIDQWPGELTPERRRSFSRFDASWADTVALLEREVGMLGGREVVLQLAITERECRNDGWIRANARPQHPGVIVSFESRHGPLRYSTDQFKGSGSYGGRLLGWQTNVRAVALGLEALRKVDRYGIARGGEQYRGWNALPPGTPMPAGPMGVDEATELLAEWANRGFGSEWIDPIGLDPDGPSDMAEVLSCIRGAYRDAVRVAHPDKGGDPEVFRRLTEARDVLLAAVESS